MKTPATMHAQTVNKTTLFLSCMQQVESSSSVDPLSSPRALSLASLSWTSNSVFLLIAEQLQLMA